MRYVIAMIFAIAVAALFTVYVSQAVANWGVGRMGFDNPDQVDNMESLLFMATNAVGLLIGWGLGWTIGGPLRGGARQ